MVAHLSEEEQLEALKRWWKDNGKSTVAVIGILLAGFFGWSQYQDHQVAKADEGSVIFEKFIALTTNIDGAATEEQAQSAKAIAAEISQNNSSSLYSDFAQLYLAKLAVESSDHDTAIEILSNVALVSKDSSIQELARLRHARVLAAKGETDSALEILNSNISSSYKAAYEEAKGDILLSVKRIAEAHTAYNAALNVLAPDQFMRKNLVQLKADHTAVDSESSAKEDSPHSISSEAGDA